MTGKRILVTGGTGFIGSHLVRRLLDQGHQVVLLSSGEGNAARLAGIEHRVSRITADLTDMSAVEQLVWETQPQLIYHLASTSFNPPGTPAEKHLRVIAMGTLALLEAARQQSGTRFLYTGSAAEYGAGLGLSEHLPLRPATLLGAAKASASTLVETYGRLYGIEAVVLRLFTPYGPWEHPSRLIPYVITSALAGHPIRLQGDGNQQRDFFYVDDLIDALMAAGTVPLPRPAVLNLCSGQGRPVREVAEFTLKLMGSPVPLETGSASRPDEIHQCSGDRSAAQELLAWQPSTSLEQGLLATIQWFKENPQWVNCSN